MRISTCCGAPVTALGEDYGICPECREHCEFEDEEENELLLNLQKSTENLSKITDKKKWLKEVKGALIILFFVFVFAGCKNYYYFDSKGCEHLTHDKSKEKEIVRYVDSDWGHYVYYYVLRGGKGQVGVAMGNLFDTTNWKQKKQQLLKPIIIKSDCGCK